MKNFKSLIKNKKVILISAAISIFALVFFVIWLFNVKLEHKNNKKYEYKYDIEDNTENQNIINKINVLDFSNDIVGYLTIPKIGIANEKVIEGTTDEVLKNNVGHFFSSSIFNGKVCLAAHNYSIKTSNLFRDLNKLKISDEIVYETKFGKRKYVVNNVEIIESTNLTVLEESDENILVLLTCINNDKTKRLCVSAIEKGE